MKFPDGPRELTTLAYGSDVSRGFLGGEGAGMKLGRKDGTTRSIASDATPPANQGLDNAVMFRALITVPRALLHGHTRLQRSSSMEKAVCHSFLCLHR